MANVFDWVKQFQNNKQNPQGPVSNQPKEPTLADKFSGIYNTIFSKEDLNNPSSGPGFVANIIGKALNQ